MLLKRNKVVMLAAFMLSVLFCAFLFYEGTLFLKGKKMEKIHVTKYPMVIGNPKNMPYFLLPPGVTLYYEGEAFEGLSRYKIYVNMFGEKQNLEKNHPEGSISPISIYPIDKSQIISMLALMKIDKDDLRQIIDNGEFSDLDKREILDLLERKE
jgi:hypothetical protein